MRLIGLVNLSLLRLTGLLLEEQQNGDLSG
jgi:hypothetical protein